MSDASRTRPAADSLPDPIHAHMFGLSKPELAAEIDSAFVDLDPTEVTGDVLDHTPRKNHLLVIHALDDVFGDLGDDFEDGDE